MNNNIEEQYDEVMQYILGYRQFYDKMYHQRLSLIWRISKAWENRGQLNLLSAKQPVYIKQALREHATPEDRECDYYAVAVSDYPADELRVRVSEKFRQFDFPKLKQYHKAKQARLSQLKLRPYFAFILGAGILVSDNVPKGLVEFVFPGEYWLFQTIIIGVTILLLLYFSLAVLLPWRIYDKARRDHQYVGGILEMLRV